jgi:hypothetical protein
VVGAPETGFSSDAPGQKDRSRNMNTRSPLKSLLIDDKRTDLEDRGFEPLAY